MVIRLIERAVEKFPAVTTAELVDRQTCFEQHHGAAKSAGAVISFMSGATGAGGTIAQKLADGAGPQCPVAQPQTGGASCVRQRP